MNQIFADTVAVKTNVETPEKALVEIFLGLSTDEGFHTRLLLNETNAKELSLMLRKVLKDRERRLERSIALTQRQFERLGVAPEDW